MDKSLLQKYSSRHEPDTAGSNVLDLDVTEDLGCFGWFRGVRERSVMLELRKKTGNCLAIGYSWIERIEFDPSQGILLVAGTTRIRIQGRSLNVEVRSNVRLFEGLTRHRVPWIQEAGQAGVMHSRPEDCLIETISW